MSLSACAKETDGGSKKLLTRPNDPMNESDIAERKTSIRIGRVEAFEFDLLPGEAAQLFRHHFAGAGFHHHAVAATNTARGRDQDTVAVAIDGQHRIARNLERIGA